ncbi:rhodanese domain-containing protein CG4456-like isoform X1 [Portunus trituberculatus]|uniref:rhodanese domain-containing protein CG4456-like isoform X1 n=1 Tax=Portunus trituberculatus TaxID=210409 RepID=UPI001E1CE9F6|nr:rhodanese domain-containing protein CG4456-like isoform X1 [Portunus trituberculatus]
MRSCRTAGDKGCVLLRMEINHKGITYDELSSSYKERTIIDVRNRNEIEACGQIPGSHCIPVTEIKLACDLDPESFKTRYGFEKPACEDDLVVCCKSGIRSKAACDLLQSKGYKRHRIYRGSFSEWEEKGGEVVKPGQPYEYNFDDSSDEEESFSGPAAENPSNLISDTSPPAPDASLQARNDYNKSL